MFPYYERSYSWNGQIPEQEGSLTEEVPILGGFFVFVFK